MFKYLNVFFSHEIAVARKCKIKARIISTDAKSNIYIKYLKVICLKALKRRKSMNLMLTRRCCPIDPADLPLALTLEVCHPRSGCCHTHSPVLLPSTALSYDASLFPQLEEVALQEYLKYQHRNCSNKVCKICKLCKICKIWSLM